MQPDGDRRRRVREALAVARLDAFVCRLPENVVLLTGCYPIIGQTWVVYPQTGEPTLIVPAQEAYLAEDCSLDDVRPYECGRIGDPTPVETCARLLRQVCQGKGLVDKAIGYEDSPEVVAPPQAAAEPLFVGQATVALLQEAFGSGLRPADELFTQLKSVKTPAEVTRLSRTNEIACVGLSVFKDEAQPGRRETEVAAAVERAIYSRGVGFKGAFSARAWAQVMSGPNTETAWYYPVSKERRIQPGDLVLIELATVVDGYWSDLTRTVVAGKASDRQREVHQLVLDAQAADLLAARPGARGDEVDAAGRRLIVERGLGDNFVHHTGHGVGFRYHEPRPWLHPDSRQTLVVGHVHTIEPGIYIPGFGGIRVEDDAVVLREGAEFLSHTDFGLD